MIGDIDRRLQEWARRTLPGISISLKEPEGQCQEPGIALYLLDLASNPPLRGARRPPLQMTLRYLITAWADEITEAHDWLFSLFSSASDLSEFEIEAGPVPLTLWRCFGISPRPAFILKVPLRQPRVEPVARMVTQPMVVSPKAMTSMEGTVVGPGQVPLTGAVVELPALSLFANTDHKGRFRFSSVPAQPEALNLKVRAKGRELDVAASPGRADQAHDLVIYFNLED
ncbi:MAG: hypothetical protein JWN34_4665 [Bryobacterales bacterium]|nr:hypothetical protein [Bryobacterales bacterium]